MTRLLDVHPGHAVIEVTIAGNARRGCFDCDRWLDDDTKISSGADHAYLRRDPRPTEEIAATRARRQSSIKRERIRSWLRTRGLEGATDFEISGELAIPLNTVRPRRLELVESGDVIDSGNRRASPGGSPATVWIAP